MPVPPKKKKLYGTIVAANIARLKRKGVSGSDALAQAKHIADTAVEVDKRVGKK